jgi:hypothetical protein
MTTKTLSKSDLTQFTGSENWYRHGITLTCDDGNGNIVFTKDIEHTDFPLDEITLYFTNNVIHLPSEY